MAEELFKGFQLAACIVFPGNCRTGFVASIPCTVRRILRKSHETVLSPDVGVVNNRPVVGTCT